MYSLPFLALFASFVLASPLKRSDSLIVKLTGPPSSISSVDDLKFTAEVTNNGAEDVKVLKFNTILDDLPTSSFDVTKNGTEVAFTGIKVAVNLNNPDAVFTTIPKGKTVTVNHDVSSLYDYATAGLGTFTFAPKTDFQVASTNESTLSLTFLSVAVPSVDIEVTGDVSRRELKRTTRNGNVKRATDVCNINANASFIDTSYTEGKSLAAAAAAYIRANGSGDSVYEAYFGLTPTAIVLLVLDNVANENDANRELDCSDPADVCSQGPIAYTQIGVGTSNIFFCPIFFNELPTSNLCGSTVSDAWHSRGGIMLHELTHATSGTVDVSYGCRTDQDLANSGVAATNADSYNCFAEHVYVNTKC